MRARLTRGVVSNTPRGGSSESAAYAHMTHTRGCLDARKLKAKLGVSQPAGRRNKNVYNHRRPLVSLVLS